MKIPTYTITDDPNILIVDKRSLRNIINTIIRFIRLKARLIRVTCWFRGHLLFKYNNDAAKLYCMRGCQYPVGFISLFEKETNKNE